MIFQVIPKDTLEQVLILWDLIYLTLCRFFSNQTHLAKIDLDKKWLPKKKTIQNFNIDAQGGFRKTRNENPPTQEIGVTS